MTVAAQESGRQAAVDLAKKQAARIRDIKRDVGCYVHDVVEALVLWQASPEGRGGDLVLPVLPGASAGRRLRRRPGRGRRRLDDRRVPELRGRLRPGSSAPPR